MCDGQKVKRELMELIALKNEKINQIKKTQIGLKNVYEHYKFVLHRVREQEAENQSLKAKNQSLKAENQSLKAENQSLKAEKQSLKAENQSLQAENQSLKAENQSLKAKKQSLKAEKQSLKLQLEEYKKIDAEESVKLADKQRKDRELEINQRIDKKKEGEIKKIAKEREEKAKDKLRQIEEGRERKKQLHEKLLQEELLLQKIEQEKDGGGQELDYTIRNHFTCRTVRIGSYKVVPKEGVKISSYGILLNIPSLVDENKCVSIFVGIEEIVQVLIHFGKGMPVIFIYCFPNTGRRIRETLKMDPNNGPYYDPLGGKTQRWIILLPTCLLEQSKIALKTIFSIEKVLVELTHNEANEILVRAFPKDVSIGMITRAQSTCTGNMAGTGDSNSVKTINSPQKTKSTSFVKQSMNSAREKMQVSIPSSSKNNDEITSLADDDTAISLVGNSPRSRESSHSSSVSQLSSKEVPSPNKRQRSRNHSCSSMSSGLGSKKVAGKSAVTNTNVEPRLDWTVGLNYASDMQRRHNLFFS